MKTKIYPAMLCLHLLVAGRTNRLRPGQWHSGFLPGQFQGVQFHSTGDPVHYVANPGGVDTEQQRDVVDAVQALNGILDETVDDPTISTRISQYEMAFRMQTSVPELTDISKEPQHVLDMYGAKPGDGSYASNCLLARRLAERGRAVYPTLSPRLGSSRRY